MNMRCSEGVTIYKKILEPFLMIVLIGGFCLMMIQKSYADPLQTLRAALPKQIQGWRAEPDDRVFDDDTLTNF